MSNAAAALLSRFGDFDPMLMALDQSNRVTACLRALGDTAAQVPKIAKADQVGGDMAAEDFWPEPGDPDCYYRPYIVKGGILMIPVKGVLLHGFSYAVGNYATGYEYIEQALKRGLNDPLVAGIALICDSPGGHVSGCFELGDKIYAARSRKSIQAFVYEHAYSAAFALASATDRITMSRTGGVGSVGVVTMHVSYEEALKKEGIQVTFIKAGKHKTDGNPYEKLGEDAKARIQKRIDEVYMIFTGAVARNRSVPEIDVRRQEALTFSATEAVDRLMADKISPMDEALAVFSDSQNGSGDYNAMTTQANGQPPAKTHTQADIDAAVAAATGKTTDEVAKASATAAKAAKDRIIAIKGLDEAKTRPAAAEACAMTTEMTVDQAKAFLAALPVEKAEAKGDKTTNGGESAFVKAMDGEKPGPGAQADDDNGQQTQAQKDDAASQRILGARYGAEKSAAKH